MIIKFGNKSINVTRRNLLGSNVRPGDFIKLRGDILRVETVQTGCPYIENTHKVFTSWVLNKSDGSKVFCRDLFGTLEVYRAR